MIHYSINITGTGTRDEIINALLAIRSEIYHQANPDFSVDPCQFEIETKTLIAEIHTVEAEHKL